MTQQALLGDPIPIKATLDMNVALSHDGSELAVPGPHGILVWQLRAASWVKAACGIVGRELTLRSGAPTSLDLAAITPAVRRPRPIGSDTWLIPDRRGPDTGGTQRGAIGSRPRALAKEFP